MFIINTGTIKGELLWQKSIDIIFINQLEDTILEIVKRKS